MADFSVGVGWVSWSNTDPHRLISWTLGMVLVTNILAALGSSSWVSWMAAGSQRLRGRYFGFRNSAGSLTLLSVPLRICSVCLAEWNGLRCVVLFLES